VQRLGLKQHYFDGEYPFFGKTQGWDWRNRRTGESGKAVTKSEQDSFSGAGCGARVLPVPTVGVRDACPFPPE
jgi:hypothetical protein